MKNYIKQNWKTILIVIIGTIISGALLFVIAYQVNEFFSDNKKGSLFIVIGDTVKDLIIAMISYTCGKYGFDRFLKFWEKKEKP